MSRCSWIGLFLLPFVLAGNQVWAQSTASPQAATSEIAVLQRVLWGSVPVHQAVLTGTATWYAGSDVEQGTVTLTATAAGSSSVELSLDSGNRKVTATDLGSARECEWSKDGTSHQMGYMNCLKPLVWFLPGITLQPGLMPNSIGVEFLGATQVDGISYSRLQAQAVMGNLDTALLKEAMKHSSMNLLLDAATMLPSELSYRLRIGNGALASMRIKIRYSDYQRVQKAEVPFHIRRYVNGALQLDIEITAVTLT